MTTSSEDGKVRKAQAVRTLYGGYAEGDHLFPFRTEQLSPSWPMVLVTPGE